MGFFYKKEGNETRFGFTFSLKFGKGSSTEEKCHKWLSYIIETIKESGIKVEQDSDMDPNKEKRLFR